MSDELLHPIDPASLAALPRTAGVYIFRGEGALPIYIGKSVDIRSRVLAHLRAPDEAAMIAQSRRVDCIETAGEIGALLLEAQLIKQRNPLFNIRLRRVRHLCAIRLADQAEGLRPEVISGQEVAPGQAQDLYGLFSSVHAAQSKLRELADQHRLCLGLLGLEKIGQRGCFGLQVKTCLGACVGQEDRAAHDQRLFSALLDLKVHAWPFAGAVDVVEQNGDWVQRHRIDGWRYQGTWCSRSAQFTAHAQQGFDLDAYKILVKPIMLGTARIELV
ncbi:MAG: endonuclease [Comamonadaceae bacterium PBBC2]|nr:MAG: endonuclease [Comamonadaceae bacterium PBBC2]